MPQRANKRMEVSDQKGQTFIEFLLLLLILIGLNFTLIRGLNGAIAVRWKAIVEVVVDKDPKPNLELQ
jgi:hypothetical protein